MYRDAGRFALLAALVSAALPVAAAEVSIGDGGSLRVTDGGNTFTIGGRARLGAIFYDEDVTDLPTGAELDQAVLSLRAVHDNRWTVVVSYEFVDRTFFDTSVTRTGLPIGDLQVGQFRPQIGLYDGGAWVIFNQRSMVEQTLAIQRTLGVGLEGHVGRVTYSLAVNGDQIGQSTPDDPLKYSTRWVVRPAPGNWGVFHVGVNAIHWETGEARTNRFAVNAIAALDDTPTLLEVSQTSADYRTVIGGEVLWNRGPLTLQSEYMHASVDSPGKPEIGGYYVSGAWIVGAERRYSEQSGTFGRPFLHDPAAGAWEFAVRYDTIDFSGAGGGSSDNIAVAIVHYFSNPLRLGTTITRSAITNGLHGDESILSVHLRLQWFL